MENTIIFVMGVSGSGKGTLMYKLLQKYSHFAKVHSYTSRPMRDGERDGENYFFVSQENFQKGIENNEFLEYALVHEKYYYGTRKDEILEKLHEGMIPIKEIDMYGLEKLKQEENPPFNYFSIFLDVPERVMIERIQSRQDMPAEELERRIHSSIRERTLSSSLCDVVIDASGTIQENLDKVIFELETHFFS